jgi:hypothetical protein
MLVTRHILYIWGPNIHVKRSMYIVYPHGNDSINIFSDIIHETYIICETHIVWDQTSISIFIFKQPNKYVLNIYRDGEIPIHLLFSLFVFGLLSLPQVSPSRSLSLCLFCYASIFLSLPSLFLGFVSFLYLCHPSEVNP